MEIVAQIAFLLIFAVTSLLAFVTAVRQIILSSIVVRRPAVSPFSRAPIARWPHVTVMVAAHNEEAVIEGCLESIAKLDYPRDRLRVLVINDRSRDRTGELISRQAEKHGELIRALHRPNDAVPGKPAAIDDGLNLLTRAHDLDSTEVVVLFDADYLPAPPLLKKLVAPFIDPQVGATMGRVVPYNTDRNLLTRLLDLERRGGYAIDQSARSQLNLLPQFGGTVGGIRLSALQLVGGWSADTLAEDTDLTYRLFIKGFSVAYVEDALCHEESPEQWPVRLKQVRRWACGHDQCLFRHFWPVLTTANQPFPKRLDAAIVLTFFLLPPLAFINLVAALIYPTLFVYPPLNFTVVSALAFLMSFGNFATYHQIIAAALRDREPQAARLLPLVMAASAISVIGASQGLWMAIRSSLSGRRLRWDKTLRYRKVSHAV